MSKIQVYGDRYDLKGLYSHDHIDLHYSVWIYIIPACGHSERNSFTCLISGNWEKILKNHS